MVAGILVLSLLVPCLRAPVEGPVVGRYAPVERYAGHWGVDFRAPVGTPVRAVAAGTVSFAGVVVGNRAVTLTHPGGVRTSYSYLYVILARRGQRAKAGDVIGRSGLAHGEPGVHVSLRLGQRYADPARFLGCSATVPAPGLRLLPMSGYPG